MYDRKALECQNRATALGRRIDEIRVGAPAPAQGAIDMMALTSRSRSVLDSTAAREAGIVEDQGLGTLPTYVSRGITETDHYVLRGGESGSKAR
jgi:hypothetical protein